MNSKRLVAIVLITVATTAAWFFLGATLDVRTATATSQMSEQVQQVWGPGLAQPHVQFIGDGPAGAIASGFLPPTSSHVEAKLHYEPKKRGLLWHRTYDVEFTAQYVVTNASPDARRIHARFQLPSDKTSYDHFVFQFGDSSGREIAPLRGALEAQTVVPGGQTATLKVGYTTRGMDQWAYTFQPDSRVKDFSLKLLTDFAAFSIPVEATSPSQRQQRANGQGMELSWDYEDVLHARSIAVEMPRLLNAGPVLSRITFFAPISLVLFFAVLMIFGLLRGYNLHPVVYAFLAAGFFSFHLLLAYLADLMPLEVAFGVAAAVSLLLVCGYLHATTGRALSVVAVVAQLSYMVLFSYSFFFDGFTGLTLTVTGIATLGLLMMATAKVDWETALGAEQGGQWKKAPAA